MKVQTVKGDRATNALLEQGWRILEVTSNGYHMALLDVNEMDDGREAIVEFLSNLDPQEVDRMALANLSMNDQGGTAAILNVLKEMARGNVS